MNNKEKTKLITAIYTDEESKKFPYYAHELKAREDRYLHSLRTIANTELEIVLYCNENQFNFFIEYCKEKNLNNVTVKISNLKEFPYCEEMKKIKLEKKEKFIHFYHEIDWNKLFLLKKEFDSSYGYMYWIDAGLSHPGLFPKKFNSHPNQMNGFSANYYNYSFIKIFNPSLFEKINNWVSDKLINISNRLLFHNRDHLNEYTEKNYIYDSMTVGGLIGGNTKEISWLTENFMKNGKMILDKGTIINHEALLSFLVKSHEEKFKTFKFESWYHEDSNVDQIEKNKISFSHFFEKELGISND